MIEAAEKKAGEAEGRIWKRWKLTMDWFLISEIAMIGLIGACIARALFYAMFGRR